MGEFKVEVHFSAAQDGAGSTFWSGVFLSLPEACYHGDVAYSGESPEWERIHRVGKIFFKENYIHFVYEVIFCQNID